MRRPEALVRRLVREGVSPGRAQRLVRELGDHRRCLAEAEATQGRTRTQAAAAADRRLGDVETLARHYAQNPALHSGFHRHPVWMFLTSPLPLAFALKLLALGLAWGILTVSVAGGIGVTRDIVRLLSGSASLLPPLALAGLYGAAAGRHARHVGWAVGCGLLLGVVTTSVTTGVETPLLRAGGVAFGWVSTNLGSPARALLPLVVAVASWLISWFRWTEEQT